MSFRDERQSSYFDDMPAFPSGIAGFFLAIGQNPQAQHVTSPTTIHHPPPSIIRHQTSSATRREHRTTNRQECQPQITAQLDRILGIQQVSAAGFCDGSQQNLCFCTLKCAQKHENGPRNNSRRCSLFKTDIVNLVPDHAKFWAK